MARTGLFQKAGYENSWFMRRSGWASLFINGVPGLREAFRKFGEKVNFLVPDDVYIPVGRNREFISPCPGTAVDRNGDAVLA